MSSGKALRHLTLNNKILLLLLGSILLVLTLVGTIFSTQVTRLHESSARAELTDSADLIRNDLLSKSRHLNDSTARIVQDENILATLNLIARYQDPANYQPLVFDPEKRNLAATLEELLHAGGFNMAAVYQADGELVAFHALTAEGEGGGYNSYQEGKALFVPVGGAEDSGVSTQIYRGFGAMRSQLYDGQTAVRFRAGKGGSNVVLEQTVPFVLQQSGAGAKILGWLRLSYYLDHSYIERMAQKLGVKLAFLSEDSVVGSAGFTPQPAVQHDAEIPMLQVSNKSVRDIAWMKNRDGFEAQLALPLDGNKHVHLVLGEGTSNLSENLNVFARSVFWVLLLSGALVLPLGWYMSRRWVSQPVKLLTDVARGITRGERPQVAGFQRHDELGVLADAFVVMSKAIMNRENELREKQRQIEGIIGNAPAVIYMKDLEGRYLLINSLYEELFSVSNEQMYGKTDAELFEEDVVAQIRENEQRVVKDLLPLQVEEVVPQGGMLHTYLSVKFPLFDDDNQVIAICGISTDITERKQAETDLMLAKNIIENANEGVVVTDLEGIITDVNEAYESITGYARDEVVGKTPAVNKSGRHDRAFYQAMWNSIHEKGYWQGEIWDRRKGGEVYPKWLSINTVRDEKGKPSNYVGIFSDITTKKATEEQLERLAYYDSLTNLPNRLLFRDRLGQEIAAARRHASRVVLFFIDLDRFKYVNDTLGHAAGDELLQVVANRIKWCVRESDTVSRLGGDEFTVIIPEVDHVDQVSVIAQKIIDDLRRPIALRGQEVQIGASVGVSMFPDDGEDIDRLSRHADMALYKAKDEGRNNFQFFSAELQTHIAERIALEEDLRKGLERSEFLLHYQPKYNLASGELSGMEALMRWQQPERGLVSPTDFIPLAEENGLIIPMSELVLREACRQTVAWRTSSGLPLKVAVNLSARQFQQPDLIDVFKSILAETGLPAEALELELTESMVMGSVDEAIRTMQAVRDLGLSLAIDDFGTGYSSLSYLKRFPINTLKIDQSFVRDLTVDSDDASIVQAIIAMGHQLDLHVVAEGVETQEQLEFLRKHGCGEVQGYLMSRPLAVEQFGKLLETEPRVPGSLSQA